MPKVRADVSRPGPKVWWELNDKAEEKVKGVIDRHKVPEFYLKLFSLIKFNRRGVIGCTSSSRMPRLY